MAQAAGTSTVVAARVPQSRDGRLVSEVFPALMDIGEAMLKSGADVHTVEQSLIRMGKAYGAERMNVLVITAVIIVTVSYPGYHERTFSRRVVGEGGTDFAKLEALAQLCTDCVKHPLTADELNDRLRKIKRKPMSRIALYLGGMLSAGGFSIFFGGSILDGIAAAIFAIAVCVSIKHFKPLTPNTIVFNFATSIVAGIAICGVAALVHEMNVNMVIIGVIMLLIPGLAMTNATRDMLSGDTISGVMRFIESLLWATSLALGFMVAIWLSSACGWSYGVHYTVVEWPFAAMIAITFVASLGFALFFNVPPRHILAASIGGLVTWMIYTAFSRYISGVFVPCLIASTFAAVYSEILARVNKVPNAIFFIISVIPMVPGRGLYYTMYSAVLGDWGACGSYAFTTLMFAAGIAVGICLIAAIVQTWDLWKGEHQHAASIVKDAERHVVHASKKAYRKVVPKKSATKASSPPKPSSKPGEKPSSSLSEKSSEKSSEKPSGNPDEKSGKKPNKETSETSEKDAS